MVATESLPIPAEMAELMELPRKRWTRAACRVMMDAGLLEPGRFELIYGEIVQKMGQGRKHIFVVSRLFELLILLCGANRVQSQSSIVIDDENEPEPDIAVLDKTLDHYLDTEPEPQNVLLIVEVADSTLRTDRAVKAYLYAQAGFQEFWIVNIKARTLEIYRDPGPTGYATLLTRTEQEFISPLAAPDKTLRVGDLLP